MNRDYFLTLAEYNRWVSGMTIGWLNLLYDDQWNQVLTSSFSSIRQTTLHLVSAEKIWLDFWQQVPNPQFLSIQFRSTKSELLQIWQHTSSVLPGFIQAYPEANYQEPVRFSWRGEVREMPFWQTFAHFINHATYHRGQLVTLLRQVGFTDLSSTDLATYIRKHQPLASIIDH